MSNRNLRRNAEGYPDPTAYEAMRNIDRDETRLRKLRTVLNQVSDLAGFRIDQITLVDKRTGKHYR